MATTQTDRVGGATTTAPPGTDLAALEALSGTGIPERTAANTWVLRPFTGSTNWSPETTDAAALGTTSLMWSDLFLASGAVINWNAGDVTLTHSANLLAFAGASSGYTFDTAVKPSANDGAALGSTALMWSDLFLASGAVQNWNNGDVTLTHSADTLTWAGATAYTFDVAPNVAGASLLSAATQAQQETGSSLTVGVTSGRQQFHDSAAKCWAYVTVSAGTPTLAASYNITSITDTGVGDLTITIATDFSSANWCPVVSASATLLAAIRSPKFVSATLAAGSVELGNGDGAGSAVDPTAWSFVGYGDQ